MDKLAERLKHDAELIDVELSVEMERRISASIEGVRPEKPRTPARPAIFWWTSSLTGIAAAFSLIAFVNFDRTPGESPPVVVNTSPVTEIRTPTIDWKAESAMLTEPLQQELENLQSDIRKAEAKVKRDIGL